MRSIGSLWWSFSPTIVALYLSFCNLINTPLAWEILLRRLQILFLINVMRGFHFPLEEQQFHYSATNLVRQDHDRINITQIQVSTPHRWFHFTMQTGWHTSVCKIVNAFGLKTSKGFVDTHVINCQLLTSEHPSPVNNCKLQIGHFK